VSASFSAVQQAVEHRGITNRQDAPVKSCFAGPASRHLTGQARPPRRFFSSAGGRRRERLRL